MSRGRRRRRSGVDAAAGLGAVGAEVPLPPADHSEALTKGRPGLGCEADPGGQGSVESLAGGVGAGRRDAGAAGKRRVGREAPVGALEEDLSSQAPQEVVDQDGAPEEGLGVVDEAHLLQGEAQHVGALLQDRRHLKDIVPLEYFVGTHNIQGLWSNLNDLT